MRAAIIVAVALVVGIVIGAGGASLYWAGRSAGIAAATPGGNTPAASSSPSAAPAAEKPPVHPIVGTWHTKLQLIGVTYQFANDGAFVLTFTDMPQPPSRNALQPPTKPEASGTWRVDGSELILTNSWSNSPMTVVGEVERATIVSVQSNQLELEHLDRKGKAERLTFSRVHPFVKGKVDNANIVGRWQSGGGTFDLLSGGDLEINSLAGTRTGAWSQAGNTLTFVIDPPGSRQRQAQQAAERERQVYDIRRIDQLRMVLHPAEAPESQTVTFKRLQITP
jgi:hypothetical protein